MALISRDLGPASGPGSFGGGKYLGASILSTVCGWSFGKPIGLDQRQRGCAGHQRRPTIGDRVQPQGCKAETPRNRANFADF